MSKIGVVEARGFEEELDWGEFGGEIGGGEAEEGDGRSSGDGRRVGGEDGDGDRRVVFSDEESETCEGIEVFWCGVKHYRLFHFCCYFQPFLCTSMYI